MANSRAPGRRPIRATALPQDGECSYCGASNARPIPAVSEPLGTEVRLCQGCRRYHSLEGGLRSFEPLRRDPTPLLARIFPRWGKWAVLYLLGLVLLVNVMPFWEYRGLIPPQEEADILNVKHRADSAPSSLSATHTTGLPLTQPESGLGQHQAARKAQSQRGYFSPSYKLLSDSIHHLKQRYGWQSSESGLQRQLSRGQGEGKRPAPVEAAEEAGAEAGIVSEPAGAPKVAMIGSDPEGHESAAAPVSAKRCALPDQSPYGDFYLGGQGFNRIPKPTGSSLSSRGLVMAASGVVPRLAVGAYVTAYLVRKVYKSTLPIEIYYVGQREAFDADLRIALEDLGNVKVLDLVHVLQDKYQHYFRESQEAFATAAKDESNKPSSLRSDAAASLAAKAAASPTTLSFLNPSIKILASYAAKPYAILASSFRENVILDAGAVPFLDPEALFTLTTYKKLGYKEFRDYVPTTPHKWDWIPEEFCCDTEAVLEYYQDTEGDSSCVVFDKLRNWDALLVTVILNGPLQHITYTKLNGDKDTWVMAMIYTRGKLIPVETVPGFLFVDYEGNNLGRKVHGQLQLLKVEVTDKRDRAIDLSTDMPPVLDSNAEGGLVPLYFNNQLFNFTQWQWNKGWTYVGSYDDYGSLYNPPTSLSPDCAPYPVESLDPISPVMSQAFDGVVEALAKINSNHCACRDDWPTQCVIFIY